MKKWMRDIWLDYKSEVLFGLVLLGLVMLSFWLGTFIPERIFEEYINPFEYVATMAVCFFGALLLFLHGEQNTLRRSWAIVLLAWGCIAVLALGARLILGIKAVGGTPDDPLFNASVTLGNLLAFMLFIYPTNVLRPGWLNWYRGMLLLLPMIVLGVVDYFVPANLLPVIMIYPVVLFLTLCRHIRKYRQWCEDNFSTLDDIDVQWIVRYLTMLAILGLSFYFIVFWYVPNRMFTQQWMFLLIFIYTTERLLYRPDPWKMVRSTAAEEEEEEVPTDEVPTDEVLTDEVPSDKGAKEEAYRATLEAWLEKEKPYLNSDFQLTDLRHVLPMNRTYLSQFINAEYGCSFYHWVSGLRIAEAKRLLTENPEIKMKDLAQQCGFSSPTVFSRAFIRETGITPSEWK